MKIQKLKKDIILFYIEKNLIFESFLLNDNDNNKKILDNILNKIWFNIKKDQNKLKTA